MRESVDQLLTCPQGGRPVSDVEVHDASTMMFEHEQDVQDAKLGCGNDEEIDGNKVPSVVPQERTPF